MIKKEKTRSITYRLPASIVEELESEATEKNISQNVLIKQILERYVRWDRYEEKIGMIPVPKKILESLGTNMEGENIDLIVGILVPIIKDSVMFIKGSYDLRRCIEALEDYMKFSGIKSDHRVQGNIHQFIIQHELGLKWSFFTEHLFKELIHGFDPNLNIKFETTTNTIIASIPLGLDFNEHEY